MNTRMTLDMAWHNLFAAKLRTVLAMLGILVGTASVVAMVSCGQMATQQALNQFRNLGTDLMTVNLYQQTSQNPSINNIGSLTTLTLPQAKKIGSLNRQIHLAAPYITLYSNVVFNGKTLDAGIVGATPNLQHVLGFKMNQGRFISFLDKNAYFCVIGKNIYNQIRYNTIGNVIGQQILLGKNYFTIIGVLDRWPQNNFFNQNINQSIIVTLVAASNLNKYTQINNIIMSLKKGANINQVEKNIKTYLQKINPQLQVFFQSAKQLITSMANQKDILTLFLGLIGGISLLVGGIGVMNIMLVSVVERKREIGIRRAVGAQQRDIQFMFLTEAVILSLAGGIIGIGTGIGISWIVSNYASWPFQLFFIPPIIGFSVSVLTGIFFGFYPAYQASRLDPIQTLRAE